MIPLTNAEYLAWKARQIRIAEQVRRIMREALAPIVKAPPEVPKFRWSDFDDRSNWSFR